MPITKRDVLASENWSWNAALNKMLHLIRVRQAQWPKGSSMYASLEDVARDAEALKKPCKSMRVEWNPVMVGRGRGVAIIIVLFGAPIILWLYSTTTTAQ